MRCRIPFSASTAMTGGGQLVQRPQTMSMKAGNPRETAIGQPWALAYPLFAGAGNQLGNE
jgi:hypothetical protein